MSAVGSCADNAAAESFFGVLKRERVNRRQYQTRAEARADIFDYIERFHNPRKRRQLEMRQQKALLLTQPSVEMGENPPCAVTRRDGRVSVGLPVEMDRKVVVAREDVARVRTEWGRISGWGQGAWPFITCE